MSNRVRREDIEKVVDFMDFLRKNVDDPDGESVWVGGDRARGLIAVFDKLWEFASVAFPSYFGIAPSESKPGSAPPEPPTPQSVRDRALERAISMATETIRRTGMIPSVAQVTCMASDFENYLSGGKITVTRECVSEKKEAGNG